MSRALFVVVALAGSASAQKPGELQAGIDAFRLGKYDEARMHLERARDAEPKLAAPLRYLAAVAKAQLRWDSCIANARRALVLEPAAADAGDTRKLHEDCRVAAGRAPRPELGDSAGIAVTSNVPGATVRVGGLVYGGTPVAPRVIPAGRLVVQIEKSGYKRIEESIETVPGIVTDVIVELEAGGETEEVKVAPRTGWLVLPTRDGQLLIDGVATPIPANGKLELSPGVRIVELRQPGKDPWRRRVAITADREKAVTPVFGDSGPREGKRRLGYIVAGGGIGLGVLGIAAFYVSRAATNEARDIVRVEIARPPGDTTPPIRTRADLEAASDKAGRWGTISNLAYGGGLVAGAIGAYLIVRNGAPSDDAPDFAIAPVTGGAVFTRSVMW